MQPMILAMTFFQIQSLRGAKHLRELTSAVEKGYRAVLFFCVQVSNSKMLKIADNIDPYYADTLAKAVTAGVVIKTWNTNYLEMK